MKHSYICSLLSLLAYPLLLASCSNEDFQSDCSRKINLSVSASKDAFTRTSFNESEGNLICNWHSTDKLIVTGKNGNKLGVLNLTPSDGNSSVATFSGIIDYSNEESLNFIYPGVKGNTSNETGSSEISIASQDGTIGNLTDYDVLTATAQVTVFADNATANIGIMNRSLAFGKFTLSGVELTADDVITISGDNIITDASVNWSTLTTVNTTPSENSAITITNVADGNDLYVAILPAGDKEITPTFTVTKTDGKTYTGSLDPRKWEASEFVRNYNENDNSLTGIKVIMTEVQPEQPADDDTVGPVFEVNGKKFKFTKANLAYNVDEKRWYLLDEQWSFLCKKGWAYANGSYYGTKESDIDLFGFGCTGLQFSYFNDRLQTPTQFDEQINAPEYFIQKTLYAGQSVNPTQQGYYYPTQNDKCNEGYTGSNLEFGIQGLTMDWGTAYELQQNNGGNYYTLLSSELSDLQSKYYMCGATITDVPNPNNSNKKGLYGCMILAVTNKDEATALLKQYGATVSGLTNSLNFTGTNYQYFKYENVKITQEQFKALEAGGKVVFLPEAGHTATGVGSYTKTDGYYWTATAGQAYTSTIFRFDGNSSPLVFKLDSQSSRIFGCSVRLVKEVK